MIVEVGSISTTGFEVATKVDADTAANAYVAEVFNDLQLGNSGQSVVLVAPQHRGCT